VDLTGNPWLVYPADVGADIVPPSYRVALHSINWANYVSPDDILELQDGNGKILLELRAGTDQHDVEECFSEHTWVRGLKVTRIDSGVLRIHYR
jgi:hypothetical protein